MRVLCMYLPQYHTFPENDEWWGKGYTEWTAVKRGKPLFDGHRQPRVPLGGRYYDLVKEGAETLSWQAELAGRYGIYGFSFYQYWFRGKQLMNRPMELLLSHPDIPLRYCVCWANETWTRTWYDRSEDILVKQEYGEEADWRKHFSYLLPFFRDERYIRIDNRPVLMIYRSFDIACLREMLDCFSKMAKEAGLERLFVVSGKTRDITDERRELIDGYYCFEPGYTLKHELKGVKKLSYKASTAGRALVNRLLHKELLERRIPAEWIYEGIRERDYEENEFPGLIPDWDNTPRRGYKGLCYTGTSPERFERTLSVLKDKVSGRKNDFVVINAWNEWGEGAMLEPDEERGYAYLEAIRRVTEG